MRNISNVSLTLCLWHVCTEASGIIGACLRRGTEHLKSWFIVYSSRLYLVVFHANAPKTQLTTHKLMLLSVSVTQIHVLHMVLNNRPESLVIGRNLRWKIPFSCSVNKVWSIPRLLEPSGHRWGFHIFLLTCSFWKWGGGSAAGAAAFYSGHLAAIMSRSAGLGPHRHISEQLPGDHRAVSNRGRGSSAAHCPTLSEVLLEDEAQFHSYTE